MDKSSNPKAAAAPADPARAGGGRDSHRPPDQAVPDVVPADPDADGFAPLADLVVIDRLEVGPVRLEPRRLIAPYRVFRGDDVAEQELIYRYQEDVFDPEERTSRNLAAMMAAQVALNYGLFCHEIVLHGPLEGPDCRLLSEMLENTAREILVKKLLEPNPFMLGAATRLEPTPKERYAHAQLRFPDRVDERRARAPWDVDRRRCAVLSSGGKDSMLTHALLDEIGCESHPIFVNESGRHWHTALNAYRHFEAEVPHTARVWTNSDRLFAWMLRHLPFVRQDFAQVRSDEYPIRLWTVAVFLFGTLPLVRKRGIGRIVIGDEFDSTTRRSHQGIPHYDGLFDQSRYFDNVFSRYYRRKRWSLSQFSILRPLSELLIEKTLVERYPELQVHQTSCHATHVEDERVRPCGSCEKCRRIVGMLAALGADPSRCGYTAEQIDRCLKALAVKGVHQEGPGAEQLAFMLRQRGLLPGRLRGRHAPRARSEVLAVRIDRERSPVDGIPRDLREPLFRIFLEHAFGAVRRVGRVWVEEDLLSDEVLTPPYPFETGGAGVPGLRDSEAGATSGPGGPQEDVDSLGTTALATATGPGPAKRSYLLGELTWPEAKQRLGEVDLALLPVGAIEQHGPHLPLDTDAFDAEYLAQHVAMGCSDPQPLVLPLVPYGVSYHHDDFPGTIGIGNEALTKLVYDIGLSAARNGITKLVIVNGHGGNAPALQQAAQLINRDARIFTCVDTGETSDTDLGELCETPNDVHAGEIETSTALVNRPHLVDMTLARRMVPRFSSTYLDFTAKRRVEWYARTARISRSGVMGDPTRATSEKGEQMWAVMIRHLVALVEDLKQMSLTEIYNRRY